MAKGERPGEGAGVFREQRVPLFGVAAGVNRIANQLVLVRDGQNLADDELALGVAREHHLLVDVEQDRTWVEAVDAAQRQGDAVLGEANPVAPRAEIKAGMTPEPGVCGEMPVKMWSFLLYP